MSEVKDFKNLLLEKANSSIYSEVDGLSLQNLFYVKNGYFPNCYMFNDTDRESNNYFDTQKIYQHFIETRDPSKFQCIKYVFHDVSKNKDELGICIVDYEKNIFARVEGSINESYVLYSNDNEDSLNEFVAEILENYVSPEVEKNNLYTIASSSGGYMLIKQSISEKKLEGFDIETQYNDDFVKEDTKICEFMEEDKRSGLIILHGEKGTGKTTYIRHLINIYPERKFVFVPSGLITLLGEPSFGSFLLSLTNHVIILEDCENAIKDRKSTGSSSAVSLLLNMTDGLLSDDLGVKFICTFNEDVKNIDPALMRKGRLVSKYEFKPLNKDKANKLFEVVYEGNDNIPTTDKDITLAEIFNFEDDSYIVERKSII